MILPACDIEAQLEAWVAQNLTPWLEAGLSSQEVATRLQQDYESDGAFCFFQICDGSVEIDPATAVERPYMVDPAHMMGIRAHFFLSLLRDAVRLFGVQGSARICLFVADEYVSDLRGPAFFFQKPEGGRGLLLPDIDLIILGYCADSDGRFGDPIPWEHKSEHAIFVGSTTGNVPLTARHVQERTNARIRAATYFRGRSEVTFELPNICQEDNGETRKLIESLNIAGPGRSWAEQQHSRYQISLDGNGATCARVAISLHSHSVLMKYSSPNILYYFEGIKPWEHYIPIIKDIDVLRALADAPRFEKMHHNIAMNSRQFAQQFLTRYGILSYTARIIRSYINAFGDDGGEIGERNNVALIDSRTHLYGLGDHYAGFSGWNGSEGRAIEGFALIPANGIIADQLSYAAVAQDGTQFEVSDGGQYCGTRGRSLALCGMSVALHDDIKAQYSLSVSERFADGYERTSSGGDPLTPHSAPLTSFRIDVDPVLPKKSRKWWRFG